MLLTGKQPAEQIYSVVDEQINSIKPVPGLFVLYDPDDKPAGWYLKSILRAGESHGIPVFAQQISDDAEISMPDQSIAGMIVLSKSGSHIAIPEALDIDGSRRASFIDMYYGGKGDFSRTTPCTAEACVRMLNYYSIPVSGKHVVILGRSYTVGRPLSLLLLNRDATVTICHSKTKDLAFICRQADILVCATGIAGLVNRDFVSSNQTVINVGGDAVEQEISGIVENLCPFKGGIGALTTAVLMKHLTDQIS